MDQDRNREHNRESGDAQSLKFVSSELGQRKPSGRPQSIPETHFVTLLRLRLRGMGYRRIASELSRLGAPTTAGSVFRFVHELPPYDAPGQASGGGNMERGRGDGRQ